jgi:hypothetical protein
MPRKRRASKLVVVPASTLGWMPATDYFLLDRDECYGPFPDQQTAPTASQSPRGSDSYLLAREHIPRGHYSRLVKVTHYGHYISKDDYRTRVLAELGAPH